MLTPVADSDGSVPSGTLQTLRYFGLFRYPLLPAEIHRFHPCRCSAEEVGASLAGLIREGMATVSPDGFYAPAGAGDWSAGRRTGNQKALDILSHSGRYTRIIQSFPFVEGIAISGSLSKYYAGDDADIDYFIITRTGRLWIARTLLHLFKKLTFIPGYQHFFCMNYFLDRSALELTDRNRYTAIELGTLIPVYNPELIADLQSRNGWTSDFLPNSAAGHDLSFLQPAGREIMKRLAEQILNLLWPVKFNRFLMRFTDRKWRRKWHRKGFPMEEYDQAFFTSVHVSKNHPANFQKKILQALDSEADLTVL